MSIARPVRRRRRLSAAAVHCLAVVAAVAMCVTPASGQAMPGLPDPMTSRELSDYVIWLEMSPQQVHALEPIHDAYLERFRRLREGEMQRLQDDVLAMISNINFMSPEIPPREDLEEIVRRADRLLKRIGQVDQSLFDDMMAVLTEDQVMLMPRIRLARQRELYSEVAWNMGREFNRGAGVDLSEMVRGLDLTPDEFAQVDPVLAQYEVQLSAKIADLHKSLLGVVPIILDTIDDLGIRGMQPEQMMELAQDRRLQNRLKRTFDEASKPFQDAASSLSKLNLSTAKRLEPLLDSEHRDEMRDRFYQRAYREVRGTDDGVRDRFRRSLETEGLTEDLVAAVRLARDTYLQTDAQIVDSIASAAEDRRAYRTADQLSEEEDHPQDDKIESLIERRNNLAMQALANLDGLLGPTITAELNAEDQRRDAERQTQRWDIRNEQLAVQADVGRGPGGRVRVNRNFNAESEEQLRQLAADPLNSEDINRMADVLSIDQAQRPLLDAMYEEYRAEYESFRDGLGPQPEAMAERMQAVENLVTECNRLDNEFYGQLGLAFLEFDTSPAIRQLIGTRKRVVLMQAQNETFGFGRQSSENGIHLPDLLREAEITQTPTVHGLLADYAESIAAQEKSVLAAKMKFQRVQMAQQAAGGDFRPGNSAVDQALMRRFREAMNELMSAREQQSVNNRQTLDALIGRLSAEQSWALQDAYNRQAFPGIYNDGESAEPVVQKAMMLDDLNARQRDELTQIAASFRSRYHQLCREMIELRRQQESGVAQFQFDRGQMPTEMIEREITLERLRFDRREASERAKMRLRVVLNEDQRMIVFGRLED